GRIEDAAGGFARSTGSPTINKTLYKSKTISEEAGAESDAIQDPSPPEQYSKDFPDHTFQGKDLN
ncbi:MAG: hypothetical protein SFW36_22445, partial [Leptolyngbyaceae cyanobacterium bins.59]|nr:hypothetical protein [Leptolyngbyaceae cyanobacterium bins.59]